MNKACPPKEGMKTGEVGEFMSLVFCIYCPACIQQTTTACCFWGRPAKARIGRDMWESAEGIGFKVSIKTSVSPEHVVTGDKSWMLIFAGKNMRLLFLLFLFISLFSSAQDVDVKNDKIIADGKEYASIVKEGCKMMTSDCYFDVKSLSGNKEIIVMLREFKDWQERRSSNPDGRVIYYEFIFIKSKKKAEIAYMGIKAEKVAKAIVKAELFKNGELDETAVDTFILINGTKFSERAAAIH